MPTWHEHPLTAQATAHHAIAEVLVSHLRQLRRTGSRAPIAVQLDGPGDSEMLEKVGALLARAPADEERGWTIVRFDAWQHQRLAPPWWWLVDKLERQVRHDVWPHTRLALLWQPSRHLTSYVRTRIPPAKTWLVQLVKDFWAPALVLLLAVALWLWLGTAMDDVLTIAGTAVSTLAGLWAVVVGTTKQIRRRVRLSNPDSTQALRTDDPMADLRRHYASLLGWGGQPVLVLVDNVGRCQADYVVDLLEGLQTLLRHPDADGEKLPFVVFVVAADRDWLCHSFLCRYRDFEGVGRRPGRPFGEPFLEKVFDLEVRLPTIPAGPGIPIEDRRRAKEAFENARDELAVRTVLDGAERDAARASANGATPRALPAFRLAAVQRLGRLEHESDRTVCARSVQSQCVDTHSVLRELVQQTDAGAAMVSRLDTAYCVHRTTQLLGGHAIEAARSDIGRLGLWAILASTWPLLAAHLAAHPEDLVRLRDGGRPRTNDSGLRDVFRDGAARQLAIGTPGYRLEPCDIARYTKPVTAHDAVSAVAGLA